MRIHIRAKLLWFYILIIIAVVLVDVVSQFVSYGAVREFEDRLSMYHEIHGLRTSLNAYFQRIDRLLRDGTIPEESELEKIRYTCFYTLDQLAPAGNGSLNSYFNVQASRRGLEALFDKVSTAIGQRIAQDKNWYLSMASAGRIAGYVDLYLSNLLSESMRLGQERYQKILAQIQRVRYLTLGGLAVFFTLFGIAALAFSAAVADPIRRLAVSAERIAHGDLDVEEVRADTGDEVEILARSFNTMILSIKNMVEGLKDKADLERKLREEERALRTAQFISLQDQIRPHFLFNALNTIARMALFEGAQETEKLTLALGRLFRYALGAPESLVPLKEEVSVVEEYLQFQKLRFGDRLSWSIRISDSAAPFPVPRFTLQPFVENAVRHGIEPKEEGGTVEIRVLKRHEMIYITVRDTGIGMPELGIDGLDRGDKGAEGIGIANVRKRLALRYGERARLSIKSEHGRGTLVRISLPLEIPDSETTYGG